MKRRRKEKSVSNSVQSNDIHLHKCISMDLDIKWKDLINRAENQDVHGVLNLVIGIRVELNFDAADYNRDPDKRGTTGTRTTSYNSIL